MWTWDCWMPGHSGAGVSHDELRALRTAEAWMREHHATAARATPVRLDAVELAYMPAGQGLVAAMIGDSITWRPAAQ